MRRGTEGDTQAPPNPLAPYNPPVYTMPAGVFGGPAGATPSGLPPANRNIPTFLGLINALKRRWVLACFLGLLAGLAGAAGVWIALPTGKHTVKAMVQVMPITNPLERNAGDPNFEGFRRNQESLIKTRTLLGRVIKDRKVSELAFIKAMTDAGDDPTKWLEDQIKLKWDADLLTVSMNGDNPEQLKTILAVLMHEYVTDTGGNEEKMLRRQEQSLLKSKEEFTNRIQNFEARVKLLSTQGVPVGEGALTALITRMQTNIGRGEEGIDEIDKELRVLEEQQRTIQARMKVAETAAVEPHVLDAEFRKLPVLKDLLDKIADAERVYADAVKKMVDPRGAVRYKEAVDDLKKQLAAAAEGEKGAIEGRVRGELKVKYQTQLEDLEDTVKRKIVLREKMVKTKEELEAKARKIAQNGTSTQLELDELRPLRDQLTNINNELLKIAMVKNSGSRLLLREEASVIMNNNLKTRMLFSGAVAVLAFVAVMVLVAYLEWRSRRVDSVEQVVNELGIRIIGTIPAFPSRASLKAGEADQNQNWRFILNESVNSTRTMLLHTAKSQSMQVIMVTSAMQGEGKTSLASQLGTSMATAGLRTLILDCDLRNPSMHRLFDVQLAPGCSEVLCQEVDVSDAVQPTTVPNLWLIPAGQCSNRVIAALAQGHPLETLFNRLRGQFDFIVVDSCPILPVADALLVGQHVDGVVLSILQDISQLPKVMNASERLTQLNIPLLGAVINGIKTDIHAYGYNYVKQLPA